MHVAAAPLCIIMVGNCTSNLNIVDGDCRYQLLEVDNPEKVVFFGISRFHESTDTVTFRQKPGSKDIITVDYETEIQLVRWYK